MTKRILSIVAVAAILAFAPLSVTTSAAEVTCRIPFSFNVYGKALPPGPYTISTRDSVVFVKGLAKTAIVLSNNAIAPDRSTGAKLVFLKTGDRYDLSEVWSGDGTGREVIMPRKHLEALRAAGTPPERIVIAANVETR
jgi:hypothetical protein